MPSLSKKLILLLCLGASAAPLAHAALTSDPLAARAEASEAAHHFNLVLAGSSGPSEIHILLSPDGQTYVIVASSALEAGSDVCSNPPEDPDENAKQRRSTASGSTAVRATMWWSRVAASRLRRSCAVARERHARRRSRKDKLVG